MRFVGNRTAAALQLRRSEQRQSNRRRKFKKVRETFLDERCLPLYTSGDTADMPRAGLAPCGPVRRNGVTRRCGRKTWLATGVLLASYPASTFQQRGTWQALLDISSVQIARQPGGALAAGSGCPHVNGIGKRCAPLHPTARIHTTRPLVAATSCQHTSYSERHDAPHKAQNTKAGRIADLCR